MKLQERIAELEAQLRVACHVKAGDKVEFDWAVLGKIAELEAENTKLLADDKYGIPRTQLDAEKFLTAALRAERDALKNEVETLREDKERLCVEFEVALARVSGWALAHACRDVDLGLTLGAMRAAIDAARK